MLTKRMALFAGILSLLLALESTTACRAQAPHVQKPVTAQQTPNVDDKNEQSAAPAVAINVYSGEQNQKLDHRLDRSRDISPEWWMVGLTVVLAAIGTGQGLVFWIQAGRLKATIDQMQKTERRQLRAYVFIRGMTIRNVAISNLPPKSRTVAHLTDPKRGPSVGVDITNSGETPAYQVVIHGDIDVLDYQEDIVLPITLNYTRASRQSIPPDGAAMIGRAINRPLTADEVDGIMNGTKAIYAWGRVDYTDAFNKTRWTTFQYFYNSFSGTVGANATLTACAQGNDGDRDHDEPPRPSLGARILAALKG